MNPLFGHLRDHDRACVMLAFRVALLAFAWTFLPLLALLIVMGTVR